VFFLLAISDGGQGDFVKKEGQIIKKKWVLLLVIGPLLLVLVSCEDKALKAENQELKAEIQELIARIKELEQFKEDNARQDNLLEVCLEAARDKWERSFKLNDTGSKTDRHIIPVFVMERIQRVYKGDCEECYKIYGKR
jgi:hypothetical protein